MQPAQTSLRQGRPVLATLQTPSRRLDAHEPDVLAPDERGEGADGVRSSADASDYGVWVAAEPLAGLKFYLTADHRLEIAHYPRVRGRTDHASDDVVGVLDVRDPVPDRLVHRVFEGHRAARHGHDIGAEELHPHDVQLLAAGVLLAH